MMGMDGALSFARIVLSLTEPELADLRENEDFDAIVAWLAEWRKSNVVDAAYRRLVGTIN
jgi:hypothetical protein